MLVTITACSILTSGLQNDHKALMKEIEEELYKIHAEAKLRKGEPMEEGQGSSDAAVAERLSPLATIDRVDNGSPASQAVSRIKIFIT